MYVAGDSCNMCLIPLHVSITHFILWKPETQNPGLSKECPFLSTAKQGDNVIGSFRPPIGPFVCPS